MNEKVKKVTTVGVLRPVIVGWKGRSTTTSITVVTSHYMLHYPSLLARSISLHGREVKGGILVDQTRSFK